MFNLFFIKPIPTFFMEIENIVKVLASKNMTSGEFEEWLKLGAIDKPAYFIAKLQDKHHLDDIENAQFYG